MMNPKTQSIAAITSLSLTGMAALAVMPYKPDGSAVTLVGLLVFVIAWNTTKALAKRNCADDQTHWLNSKTRHEILFAIILASLLLFGGMVTTLMKELEFIEGDITKRIIGINIGLMLIVMGNYMPKKPAQSCGKNSCITSTSRKTERFLGWVFVLAGIIYAGVWLLMDLSNASVAVLFSFPAALAAVFLFRFVYAQTTKTKPISNEPRLTQPIHKDPHQ